MMNEPIKLFFLGTYADKQYLPYLKGMFGTASVSFSIESISTVAEVVMHCKRKGITGVVSTNTTLLSKLCGADGERKKPSLDSFAGSLFKRDGIEFVFINPLEHFVKVPYGKWIAKRHISKLSSPEKWPRYGDFKWEVLDATNSERIFASYLSADIIAIDIETRKEPLSIDVVGYTAAWIDKVTGEISTHSCVIECNSEYNLAIIRKFNWELPAGKVLQNGKYDHNYLLRYNAPVFNWLWDTATMFHCIYSELPKDLAFLGAFYIRDAIYWKDLAHSGDRHEYLMYNCRDTWTTALVAIEWLRTAPDYAKENYLKEFPLNFPSMLCELTGIKRDMEVMAHVRVGIDARIEANNKSLSKMVGWEANVNSPKQMKLLCKILGLGEVESTDEKALNKFMFQHPLNDRILGLVLEIRGDRKLKSTYLRTDDDISKTSPKGAKEFNGRILYSLVPHGTDTGRNASKEHHFWCGLQFQNIPRDDSVKQTLKADEGFMLAEVDLEQAESRDTAYISGDRNLIEAVSGTKDFHSVTASAISGRSYEELYDDGNKKSLDKEVRYLLGKKINHACSYNMGDNTFVAVTGPKELEKARKLLKLSPMVSYKQMAGNMIEGFHTKYPGLRGNMYPGIIAEIKRTGMLTGPTGWVRYCFDNPATNKSALNAYIAHMPQSCNAMGLNKAFMRVFYEIAMNPEHKNNFKLLCQIHDSILFQFRIGHEYLNGMVQKIMEEESTFTYRGYDGVVRTWTVPAAIKAGKDGKGAMYWSETE